MHTSANVYMCACVYIDARAHAHRRTLYAAGRWGGHDQFASKARLTQYITNNTVVVGQVLAWVL